jgi:site-specific DNA-cytosine methylase
VRTIEFFCGTKSFSKVMATHGHSTFTLDNDSSHEPDLCISIMDDDFEFLTIVPIDRGWFSPPCTKFSIASLSHYWSMIEFGGVKYYTPKNKACEEAVEILDRTIYLISQFIKHNPNFIFYIENPRGMMRKIIDKIFMKYTITEYRRVTVTYCQYGDSRMKPTDIWTNDFKWVPRPMCKNGDACHESAPRGSKTGTQGLKNAKDRGVIPPQLFEDILINA